MIDNKEKLKRTISLEFSNYYTSRRDYIRSFLLNGISFKIWRYQKNLRKLEYYKNANGGGYGKIMFIRYSRKVRKLGLKLGFEIWHGIFDEGLLIYHSGGGIVVNSMARVGKNCHLHGNNCIGGDIGSQSSPKIGDNCVLGVGAKIIGDLQLGNDITIGAGAVVVKSCLEDGVTLAGVPARIIKRKCNSVNNATKD